MAVLGVRSTVALHQLTGINRSSLNLKMVGQRKWQVEDLQVIASKLQTTVAYLLGETDDPSPIDHLPSEVHAPRGELERRLAFLGVARQKVAPGDDDPAVVPRQRLEAVAVAQDVPIEYLTEFDDEIEADRVEALVEFTRTVQASGVQRIAARSLGALSASELRALTRVISSR